MRPCAKPWGSENASSLHEEEGLEGVRSARVKSQLCQVRACSASGLVFLTSKMGRMIPGPYLQGSFRDPGVHCLSQLWLLMAVIQGASQTSQCRGPTSISPIRMWGAGTGMCFLNVPGAPNEPPGCRSLTQRLVCGGFCTSALCPRGRGRQDFPRPAPAPAGQSLLGVQSFLRWL